MALRDSPFMPSQQSRTYVNPADKKALRMYQTFHKLPVTGTMNPRTAKHMRDNNVRLQTPKPRSNVGRRRRVLPSARPYSGGADSLV